MNQIIKDDNSRTINGMDSTYQFKVGSGLWISGELAASFNSGDVVWARKKATKTALPSQSMLVYFAPSLDLNRVTLYVAKGVLLYDGMPVTDGTLQYSLDGNIWFEGFGNIQFKAGVFYVREAAKPYAATQLFNIEKEALDISGIIFNVMDGTLIGTSDNVQYSIAGGPWIDDIPGGTTSGIKLTAGTVRLRGKASADKLPSDEAVLGTIAAVPMPGIEAYDAANCIVLTSDNTIIIIATPTMPGDSTYEYKIGNGQWIQGDVAGDFTGSKTVIVRKKSTATQLYSEEKVLEFTEG